MSRSVNVFSCASWVWPYSIEESANQYVEFRHEIQVEEPDDAKLLVSVDSNYALWINGCFVDCGQFHDFPDLKTYDTLAVSSYIRQGRNVIALLAYYQGEGSFQYIKRTPGVKTIGEALRQQLLRVVGEASDEVGGIFPR